MPPSAGVVQGRAVARPSSPARLAGALLCAVLASPAEGRAQHGLPSRVLTDQRVGDYRISLWAAPDVGHGRIFVVYEAAEGAAFVAPKTVLVGVAPVSGRLPEKFYHAHPERVRHGARFVAHVAFDREEEWRVRVVSSPPAGGVELVARVHSTPLGGLGPFGLALYSLPFVAVAVLRWRATTVSRRRSLVDRPALAS